MFEATRMTVETANRDEDMGQRILAFSLIPTIFMNDVNHKLDELQERLHTLKK